MTAAQGRGMTALQGPDALRVLIVDDEPLARARLRQLVSECAWPPTRVVAEAGSAAEALHLLAQQAVDVLLLDIGMPGLDGMQLAQRLKDGPAPQPCVVFITAHAQHALKAFELAALDYLPKPVRRVRLYEALGRAAAHARVAAVPAAAAQAGAARADTEADEPVILVHERGLRLRVPVSEVLYLRAELKYVTVRTARQSHVIDESLTELEPRLGARFLRVHRNALVAKSAMCELQRGRVDTGELADTSTEAGEGGEGWSVRVAPVDEWLTVSRRQVPLVKEAIAAGVV